MKDFIYAALPWIIMGLTIAVLAVKFSKANSKKDNEIVDKSNIDNKKEAHNNMRCHRCGAGSDACADSASENRGR